MSLSRFLTDIYPEQMVDGETSVEVAIRLLGDPVIKGVLKETLSAYGPLEDGTCCQDYPCENSRRPVTARP